jgi:hypothetical protein
VAWRACVVQLFGVFSAAASIVGLETAFKGYEDSIYTYEVGH